MPTDDDIRDLLDDETLRNEPSVAVGYGGASGPRPDIARFPEPEMRRRREAVASLLASGYSRDRIIELMGQSVSVGADGKQRGYAMTEAEVDRTIETVKALWEEDSADFKRYAKEAAQRRLLAEIDAARREKAHNAIANLENVLMKIQGTAEPVEIQQVGDTRISEAILRLLGELDPVKVRVLIERERMLEASNAGFDMLRLPVAEVDSVSLRRTGTKDKIKRDKPRKK